MYEKLEIGELEDRENIDLLINDEVREIYLPLVQEKILTEIKMFEEVENEAKEK